MTDDQMSRGDHQRNRREPEQVAFDHLVIGEPAECVERLEAYAELGIGHVACLMNFGGPDLDVASRSIRLFGERVIPRFPTGPVV